MFYIYYTSQHFKVDQNLSLKLYMDFEPFFSYYNFTHTHTNK